jgi:ketosteroid isomerase-like protein
MRKLVLATFVIAICVGLTWAQAPETKTKEKAAKGPSVSQAIKDLEKEWAEAGKAADTAKLGEIIADDWSGIGPDGKSMTKAEFIDGYKSGKMKTESFDMGAVNVKVLGSIAVAQGSDKEKSLFDGKDYSGTYAWTDVFAKRDGKWVAVRSQTAKIK